MKYLAQYAGKWVVAQRNVVIAEGKNLKQLRKKMESRKDATALKYTLVPRGFMAG